MNIDKKDLLENIRDYSPKEIAAAINAGIVSFYELRSGTHGQFTPMLQRQVKQIIETGEEPEPVIQSGPEPFQPEDTAIIPPPPPPSRPVETTPVPPPPPPFRLEKSEPVRQPETEPFRPMEPEPVISGPAEQQAEQTRVEDFTPVQISNPTPSDSQARLIPCPECGNMVSPLASQCPVCGLPFTMVACKECGTWVSSRATECPSCGMPIAPVQQPYQQQPYQQQPYQQPYQPGANFDPTYSGQGGPNDHLGTPPNIHSFSWGGFVLGWLWGVCNGVYWSLVLLLIGLVSSIMPLVLNTDEGFVISILCSVAGLIISIILGVKGNKLAWKSKRFNSIDHFVAVQKGWRTAGLIVFWIGVGLVALIFFIILLVLLLDL